MVKPADIGAPKSYPGGGRDLFSHIQGSVAHGLSVSLPLS